MDKYTSEDYKKYGADRIKNSPFHRHLAAKASSEANKSDSGEVVEPEDHADIKTGNTESSSSGRD